jgi:hypothetical protein
MPGQPVTIIVHDLQGDARRAATELDEAGRRAAAAAAAARPSTTTATTTTPRTGFRAFSTAAAATDAAPPRPLTNTQAARQAALAACDSEEDVDLLRRVFGAALPWQGARLEQRRRV